MAGQYRALPAILLAHISIAAVGIATADAAEKSQYTCTSGDLVRRVIVEVGDLATSLPCEVVYWKDKEAPGVRSVLWNAGSDAAFCDGKAAGLVDKLAGAGWQCDQNGEAVQTNAAPAPAPAPQPATTTTAAASTSVPAVDAATVAGSEPAPSQAEQSAASTQPAPATASEQPAASASLQTAAVAPETPAISTPSANQLENVIQDNLTSLNQSVDGDFEATIGDFGDLNNDGIDDAVVFFNYQSSTADFTQFVAAYLFNGEKYHLAATKPVGGTDLAVRQVEVDQIVDGSIELRLVLNDASQTENKRAAMVLRDGQLVETE